MTGLSRRRPISVELRGGLGNQLFTFMAGAFLANRLRVGMVMLIPGSRARETDHKSALSSFKLGGEIRRVSGWRAVGSIYLRLAVRKIFVALGISKRRATRLSGIFTSQFIGFDPDLCHLGPGMVLQGHFQTYEYLQHLAAIGPTQTLEIAEASNWFVNMSAQIARIRPTVIHVRRGDYLLPENRDIGALSKEYYLSALQSLGHKQGEAAIWVFSDDLPAAKRELRDLEKHSSVFWVEPPPEVDSAESLILMSKAPRIVISNSTFSWWAAAISGHNDVVAPTKWFRNMEDPKNLIPGEWRTAHSSWVN